MSLWYLYCGPPSRGIFSEHRNQVSTSHWGWLNASFSSLGQLACRGMILRGYSGAKDWEVLGRLSVSAGIWCLSPLAREVKHFPWQAPAMLCFLWLLRTNAHWVEGPPCKQGFVSLLIWTGSSETATWGLNIGRQQHWYFWKKNNYQALYTVLPAMTYEIQVAWRGQISVLRRDQPLPVDSLHCWRPHEDADTG